MVGRLITSSLAKRTANSRPRERAPDSHTLLDKRYVDDDCQGEKERSRCVSAEKEPSPRDGCLHAANEDANWQRGGRNGIVEGRAHKKETSALPPVLGK